MRTEFKLYKVDIKYIRNLHKIDDKVLSVSPQTGKDNRAFVDIVVICGVHYADALLTAFSFYLL